VVIEIHQIFINRKGLNSVEFESSEIEVEVPPDEERTVEFLIVNYGTPMHINLSVSEELKDHVTFLKENPYVKYEEVIPAVVRLDEDELRGELVVTTGYGAYRSSVPLILRRRKRELEPPHRVEISPRSVPVVEEREEERRRIVDAPQALKALKYAAAIFAIMGGGYFAFRVISSFSLTSESLLTSSPFWISYLLAALFTYLTAEIIGAVYLGVER